MMATLAGDVIMQDQVETEEDLKARIAELEERVRLLTGDPAAHQRLRPHGFNPRQAKALVLLARAAPSTIAAAAFEGESVSSVKVMICKTRKVMTARGVPGSIETLHSSGYRADPDLAAWVLERIKEPEQPQPEQKESTDDQPQAEVSQ